VTNDTLTDGLTNDRYVKAVRLVDDFEDEVYDRIKDTLDDIMTSEQEGLFDNNLVVLQSGLDFAAGTLN